MIPIEKWVEEWASLFNPRKIYWCDGSEEEARRLVKVGLFEEKINDQPVLRKLNHSLWPNSYLSRSHPNDTARTEHLTYVCHTNKEIAGPNNNWMNIVEAKEKLKELSRGCMNNRTMYVLPYLMGHQGSPYAKSCVQITDSVYVALSMRIMTRLGKIALEKIGNSENFAKGLHSLGDLDPNKRFVMHFPEENLVWSIGSGYGGNALLGKKCFALRLASWQGYQEGWLAEHMLIIGIENPNGKIIYIAAAFPSACGKTNLAMLESQLPGYKIWTVGDDIAWMHIGSDGRLWAINPENGFFGVAPGTSLKTNPNMIKTLKRGLFFPTLFTNTALNADTNEPWWEGLDDFVPKNLFDWQGNFLDKASGTKAAHPNSRFAVSIYNAPTLSAQFDNPEGVPISAIIFGGRRGKLIPLVTESFNWQHGVFLGAQMGSETTAAAIGKTGVLRRDPMAMLPFCGYNIGDYLNHWLGIGEKLLRPPKIFSVNWFRSDKNGNFLWPGFGQNIHILKWITDRVDNRIQAQEGALGLMPYLDDLSDGIISREKIEEVFFVQPTEWQTEIEEIKKFFEIFGKRLPKEMWQELEDLKSRLHGYSIAEE